MNDSRVVIVGAGQAGFDVAAGLRKSGFAGPITLIGDESDAPYKRPPLSKTYMKEGDGERLLLRKPAFFDDKAIDLRTDCTVLSLDRDRQRLSLADGSLLDYDRLVLATGTRNRRLPIAGRQFENVVELRTLAHADDIRQRLQSVSRIVVIGGGFIGLEFAAMARALDKDVTVIEAADRLMKRATSEPVSSWMQAAHERSGVGIHLSTQVNELLGDAQNQVRGVMLNNGVELAADMVLICAGVVPNAELAEAAGLAVDNGIVINGQLKTSDDAIFAIGDCASFPYLPSGRMIRLESVQNASDQAKHLVAGLMGDQKMYDQVCWFWSDQGDYKLKMAGLNDVATEHVIKPDSAGDSLSVFCFEEGVLIGVETVNQIADFASTRTVLNQRLTVTKAQLIEANYDLKAVLSLAAKAT